MDEKQVTTRRSKLMPVEEALSAIRPGHVVAIGGSLFHNKPMHLVREIVRRKLKDLIVIGVPQASIDIDLLIAGGCVAEVRAPYLGFDHLGLAPSFRRAAASGGVRIWECDETQLLAGLEASAKDLPSGLVKAGVGTDIPSFNPDIKVVSDPITDEPVIAVGAIRPDFALLHAAAGDIYGNLSYAGYPFGDQLIAEATKRGGGVVVASVDEVVSLSFAAAEPRRTEIAHMLVDAVVEAPYGAHPCSSHGVYQFDESGLKSYLAAASGNPADLEAYMDATVFKPCGQLEYLDAHVKPSTLVAMRSAIHG